MSFETQPLLEGELVYLRPLENEDFEDLYAVASDPLIWELHPMNDRHERAVFEKFFAKAIESGGAFAICDDVTDEIIGCSRYYQEADHPDAPMLNGAWYIGYTFISRNYWGGAYNREIKKLMLDHAFQFVDTVYFHVGEHNYRSQRAMEKIGGKLHSRINKLERAVDSRYINSLIYEIKKVASALQS